MRKTLFTAAQRVALRESAGDPFVGLSPELQEAMRRFAEHLAFWMGNTSKYSVKELLKIWKDSPELRAWLKRHVNLASYTLYYGTTTNDRKLHVGAAWKGPSGTQHWSTDPHRSRGFAGLNGRVGGWPKPGGVLVQAHAAAAAVIVDVDRFSHVCGLHRASFSKLMTKNDPKEMFSGEAYEAEVITTSAVKGKVTEVEWF